MKKNPSGKAVPSKPARWQPDWENDPRIRFATSIGPAAKAVRPIRDAWSDHWLHDSDSEGITDKGVVYEAISTGLNILARKHLRDPRLWKGGADIWDEAKEVDAGLYVLPVFRPYPEGAVLEREEALAAAGLDAARKSASVRQAAKVIQLFAQEPPDSAC